MRLNRNTKKAQELIERFTAASFTVWKIATQDVQWLKPARLACVQTCVQQWTVGAFVLYRLTQKTFSCGWLYEDKETGKIMLNVETYHNNYTIEYYFNLWP